MDRVMTGPLQSICQCGRKLSVDQKLQALLGSNDGMIGLPRREGQRRVDIRAFKVRIVPQNFVARLTRRQPTQHIRNGHTQAADARATVHTFGVDRDPCEQVRHQRIVTVAG